MVKPTPDVVVDHHDVDDEDERWISSGGSVVSDDGVRRRVHELPSPCACGGNPEVAERKRVRRCRSTCETNRTSAGPPKATPKSGSRRTAARSWRRLWVTLAVFHCIILGIDPLSQSGSSVLAGRRFARRHFQRSPMYERDGRDQFARRWLALHNGYDAINPTIRPSAYLEPSLPPPSAIFSTTTLAPHTHFSSDDYNYDQYQHQLQQLPRPSPGLALPSPSDIYQQAQNNNFATYQHQPHGWEQFNALDGHRPDLGEVNQIPLPFVGPHHAQQHQQQQHSNNYVNSHQQPPGPSSNDLGSGNKGSRYRVIVNVKPAYERFYVGSHVNPLNVRRKEKSLLVLNFVETEDGQSDDNGKTVGQPQHYRQNPATEQSPAPFDGHSRNDDGEKVLKWLQQQQQQQASSPSLNRISKYFDGGELQLKNVLDRVTSAATVVAAVPTTPSPSPLPHAAAVTPESATALIGGKPGLGAIVSNLPQFGSYFPSATATTEAPSPAAAADVTTAAQQLQLMHQQLQHEFLQLVTVRPSVVDGGGFETAGRYDRVNFPSQTSGSNRYQQSLPPNRVQELKQAAAAAAGHKNVYGTVHRTTTTTGRPWPDVSGVGFVKTSPTAGYAQAPRVPTYVSFNGSPMPSQQQQQTTAVSTSYLNGNGNYGGGGFATTTTSPPPAASYGVPSGTTSTAYPSAYHGQHGNHGYGQSNFAGATTASPINQGHHHHYQTTTKAPYYPPKPQAQAMLSYAQPYPVSSYKPDPLASIIDAYKPPSTTASNPYHHGGYQNLQNPYAGNHLRDRTTTSTARPWPEQIWNRPEKVYYFGKLDNKRRRAMAQPQNPAYNSQALGNMYLQQYHQQRTAGSNSGIAGENPLSTLAQAYLQHAIAAGELTKRALLRPPAPPPSSSYYPNPHTQGSPHQPHHSRHHQNVPDKIVTRAEVKVETTVSPWVYKSFQVRLPVRRH